VTGAGSGIGRATAQRFARGGACVIVSDIDGDAAAGTVESITAGGGSAHGYVLDVRDAVVGDQFAAQIRDVHGVPDVVVNNAGLALFGAFLDQSAEDWERIVGVNLMGVVHGCRTFGAQMAERGNGGQIVNIASCAAWIPNQVLPSYAVTKAAVLMLSECLRIELAGRGVGVTAICPSLIRTNIAANAIHAAVSAEESARRNEITGSAQTLWPIGPDKVARAITRAVRRNIAILPVNPDAWLSWGLYRLSPALARTVARLGTPGLATVVTDELLPRLARLPPGTPTETAQ
jgi:NAD(P)-dependent dehydrogenase (short-subunit alcohol dehydrogenase family)